MYVWRPNSYTCAAICFDYLELSRPGSGTMGVGNFPDVKWP